FLFNIISAPLYINQFLKENLHEIYDSVIFCSATLTVNQQFQYFENQIGLGLVKDREIVVKTFTSPFDYQNQVLFTVPTDIDDPRDSSYNDQINEFIKKSIGATKGSAFVLFTSFVQLKRSFEETSPYIRELGYRSFYQGEMEKGKLLNTFKNELDSNLFATDSFWEGVDAPGKTLRYVILTKLPFRMPSEPVEEARVEDMEKRGINPFLNYTLPAAIIRFRQGFGRLIRSKNDYGIVALLDSRVAKKSYGKLFFHSLPRCQFISGDSQRVIKKMATFIENKEAN
ncbi:MAG: hypothetical protein MJB14_10345, partial [Spirochaetes bacterium]|nr:hypothetical protein [Spirochaetota bacterium]